VAQESGRSEERIEALRAALAASQEDKDELNEKRELQLDEVGPTFGLLSFFGLPSLKNGNSELKYFKQWLRPRCRGFKGKFECLTMLK
jgi:hypothetical protein